MKLMILGGGENQKLLFETANKLGVEIVLCDYSENAPCVELADVFHNVSTLDYKEILDVAKKEKINGIITNSEPAVHIATGVANELGLPSNKLSSIEVFLDSAKLRTFLIDNGFFSAKFAVLENNDVDLEKKLDGFKYPLMLKPIGSSASRGINKVDKFEDVLNAVEEAAKFSREGKVIAEEFIQRDHNYLVGGDIFVYDSEVVVWGIMNYMRDKYGNDNLSTGSSYPTFLSEKRIKIYKEALSRMFKLLDIKFGSFNLDAIFDADDNLFIIEVNPRNGGNRLSEMLKLSTGVDLNVFNIKSALGMKIEKEEYSDYSITPHMTYLVHSNKDGLFDEIVVSEDFKKKIVDMELKVKKGDKVEAHTTGDKVYGSIIFKFENVDEMKTYFEKIDDEIYVSLL